MYYAIIFFTVYYFKGSILMAEIYVLQTGKMLVSTAVHDRDSKKGKLAYTGILQGMQRRAAAEQTPRLCLSCSVQQ